MSALPFDDWSSVPPGERDRVRTWCRERLHRLGPLLNATVSIGGPAQTSPEGPLAGLPYATKDMFDRRERAATWGGVRHAAGPTGTADILTRLDRAGAEEFAVSSMTELAYEPSGYNAIRGRTLNPWHRDVVSGGSSSGSAALVACGAVFLAIGSDTGGSVRMPASCCGITGLKPTAGAISTSGAMPLAPSLDAIGLFARSARDLAMIWPLVADVASTSHGTRTELVVFRDVVDAAEPEIRAVVEGGLAALQQAGFAVSGADAMPLIEGADRHALTIMQAEAAEAHLGRDEHLSGLSEVLRKRLRKGLEIPPEILAASLADRSRLEQAFSDLIGPRRIAALPVLPFRVPLAAEADPASASFSPRVLYRMSSLTRFVNVLGWPALSLPIGFDSRGVPVGLQLLARRGAEMELLDAAARVQRITDWHKAVPEPADHAIPR